MLGKLDESRSCPTDGAYILDENKQNTVFKNILCYKNKNNNMIKQALLLTWIREMGEASLEEAMLELIIE